MAWVRTPLVLFLVASVAIGGVAGAAMSMQRAVRGADAVATKEALDLGEVERLRGLRERISRKARTFLLTGDERFMSELRASERAFSDLLSSLRSAATSPERELTDRLEERETVRRAVTERLIAARRSGATSETLARALEGELQPILDTLDATIIGLIEFHQGQVGEARAASEKIFSGAVRTLWAAAAVALFGAALSSLVLARTLRRIEGRAGRLLHERDRFFELSIDMVCIAGTDGYFKQLNHGFEASLGYTRAELCERPFLEFVHDDDREATLKAVTSLAAGRPVVDFENRYACKDGTYKWLSWHASPQPDGVIYAVARDVTESKANQDKLAVLTEELRVMAVIDEQTGLNNRRGFNILAEQHLKHAQRTRRKAVFFFADLDGLKQINDKLGHAVGDQAIRDAGTLLVTAFRKSDVIARLGGDEFVILATDAAADQVQPLVGRIQEQIRRFNSTEPPPAFSLAMSIGPTIHDPDQPETVDAILKRADQTMYEQKARRKSVVAGVKEARPAVAEAGPVESPK